MYNLQTAGMWAFIVTLEILADDMPIVYGLTNSSS